MPMDLDGSLSTSNPPKKISTSASATILTYGSYGLGVHISDSDLDLLCIVPCFANMVEDFFISLYKKLASRPEVSDIYCVKEAKVPLVHFKFDGIPVDLPYAQIKADTIPEDMLSPTFDWTTLFEPYPYAEKYGRLVKIFLSASNKDALNNWVGFVKSRIHWLLVKLEELQGFCDPNPTNYSDSDSAEVNVVLYWGLHPGRDNFDIKKIEMNFRKNISNQYQGPIGKMELSIVRSSQLLKKIR